MSKDAFGKPGLELIQSGNCPIGNTNPTGCMFCPYGHMTECHHPYTCDSDMCNHYDNTEENYE